VLDRLCLRTEGNAALFDVRAGDIEFEKINRRLAEPLHDLDILLFAVAADIDHDAGVKPL